MRTAETSISAKDMKALLLSVLVEHGVSVTEADRLCDKQTARVWKQFGGKARYFRKDHPGKETSEARRKKIYKEWWTHRPTGEALQIFLVDWNIGERRLQQIVAEGRKKKWAA